ncbi:S-adenosylmethionine:2-demethylmenaquinone methyltransferase [gamma proteobacterium HTCC5015]|nr:S-adenosylmethionine:2-demethylmenaquinone methyltransferase [gamma proteobacterium HTCC5015]
MSFATCDLSDDHQNVSVALPGFRDFGGRIAFGGPITTLKVFEDNTLVREQLEKPGEGRVLVVDGGGSMRCALVGGNLAELGVKNGWAGIIVFGCIRDSKEIGALEIGVKALDTMPQKSVKRGEGQIDLPVTFHGVTFTPGEYTYADEDGVVVAPEKLA